MPIASTLKKGNPTMPSVLQPWLHELPFMQQTVLLTAIRAPDGTGKYSPPKMLLRWLRRCVLISALDNLVLINPFDPRGGSFTGPSCQCADSDPSVEVNENFLAFLRKHYGHGKGRDLDLSWFPFMWVHVGEYLQTLDSIPLHFHKHFLHACEILGYQHPNESIRVFWHLTYLRLVDDLHLSPESKDAMNSRLGDDRSGWLARGDIATEK
jgi:hypothetical protein